MVYEREMQRVFVLCLAATMALLLCRVVSADDKSRISDLIARAKQGNTDAQAALAVRYRDGKGLAKDDAQAMHWAHLAADHGNATAMDFIGYAYLVGHGVKANPDIAFGYFHAAAAESARGAFNLGQCYFGGQGTALDVPKALAAWKKAAELGDGRSAAEAAMIYLSGEGVAADPAQALRLATQAAKRNDPSGLVILGEIQFQAGRIDKARADWEKASRLRPVRATGSPTEPNDNMSAQEGADLLKLIDYRRAKANRASSPLSPARMFIKATTTAAHPPPPCSPAFRGRRSGPGISNASAAVRSEPEPTGAN